MDALLTTFVAATLGEWGDRTQWLVALLAARSGTPVRVMIGLFAAALLSSLVAAFAGVLIASTITIRAMTLMVALSLLFAGVSGFIRRREPSAGSAKTPVILAAFILCLAAELGDRTQFMTFALAGRFDSPMLAAAGATAGIFAAAIPAALLGERLRTVAPMRAIRIVGAVLFLVAGFLAAINALQLT